MPEQIDHAAIFSEYDFIVVLDGSGSMSTPDTPTGKSRWNYCRETVGAFAREIEAIDTDGIGFVYFNGGEVTASDNSHANEIDEIFTSKNPRGGTPAAQALIAALKLAGKSDKKDFVLFITDGEPDDKAALTEVIKKAANATPSDDALTILFLQVGKDLGATSFLKSLDDNIKGAKHDIVDVKTVAEAEKFDSIGALVAAAIAD